MAFGAETYSTLSDLDVSKYNSDVRFMAAKMAIHPQFFTPQNTQGNSHAAVFTVFDKLDAAKTDIDLTTSYSDDDPSITNLSDSQATVTAYEWGNLVGRMQATKTSVIDVDAALRQAISINAGEGLDNVAAYYIYNGLTTNADFGTVNGPLGADRVDMAITTLKDTPAPPFPDGLYAAIISPRTERDLFGEGGDDPRGYIPVNTYANPDEVYNRELGSWMGIRWVSGSSAYHATSDGIRHDYPIIFGYNAFGMAMGYDLQIVVKVGQDKLDRLMTVGWKAQRGYGVIVSDYVVQFDCQPSNLTA